jgi:preprotein translocase subunit SecE
MLEKIRNAPAKLATFYGEVKSELRKVTWPSRKEVYSTTIIVIVTVFFFGFYLFAVDLVLKSGVEWILGVFS